MTNEPRRLRRSADRKIAGVAGGIADYLDLDPTLVRLGFVAIALLGLGTAVIGYVAAWLVMPGPDAEPERAGPPTPQSTWLLAILAVVLVLSLAGGIAWMGMLSMQLLRISLPVWIVLIVAVFLIVRSRRARTS